MITFLLGDSVSPYFASFTALEENEDDGSGIARRGLGAFRGVTRLGVDGNQGRGGVSSSSIAGHNDICQS